MGRLVKCENCGQMVESSEGVCPICFGSLREKENKDTAEKQTEPVHIKPDSETSPIKIPIIPKIQKEKKQDREKTDREFVTPEPIKKSTDPMGNRKNFIVIIAVVVLMAIGYFAGKRAKIPDDGTNSIAIVDTSETTPDEQSNTSQNQTNNDNEEGNSLENSFTEKEPEEISIFEDDYENSADVFGKYGIDKNSILDYNQGLDYSNYVRFDGTDWDIDYYGYYPAAIFNSVEYVDTERTVQYGSAENTITFTTSEGGHLIYEYIKRDDSSTIEDYIDYIYNSEEFRLAEFNKILKKYPKKDGHGTLVLTGMIGENGIYEVFRIKNDCVMRMEYSHTPYNSFEDKAKGWYITECLYKMCGFSGNTQELRSYEEFYNADNTGLRD